MLSLYTTQTHTTESLIQPASFQQQHKNAVRALDPPQVCVNTTICSVYVMIL